MDSRGKWRDQGNKGLKGVERPSSVLILLCKGLGVGGIPKRPRESRKGFLRSFDMAEDCSQRILKIYRDAMMA